MTNAVGVSADIGAGQRLGKTVPQPVIVVAIGVAAESEPLAIAASTRVAPWAGNTLSRVTSTDEVMY
ncbi:hypothetical protein, partial [Acinetobacter sp. LH3_13]|uniref:hypothetical protein n=1 Tax=Acinetobacter sp. LH3_13 TaxID=3434463 RepID=UPI003EB74418